MSCELPTVILNLVQDLTEDWEIKARGEMLKQVQHDATQKRRLEDAKPKANSRGFLNPWKKRRIK